MSWEDLLSSAEERVLPWVDGRKIHDEGRTWSIQGKLPPEHGWYIFDTSSGRKASLIGPAEPDVDFETGRRVVRGYLAGNRLIPDGSRVDPDPDKLVQQTVPVFLVEPGLDRFARAVVAESGGRLIYIRQEFPEGPEMEVQEAYQDRMASVSHVREVTPALDLTFRWISHQRIRAEEREREREKKRLAEERKKAEEDRLRQAMRDAGTGIGRRTLAKQDFKAAARAALAVSGAQLLDAMPSRARNEMVVQYRFRRRRLECVVDKNTLQVIDSGICLVDHDTGEKGDTYFTLESLPPVIGQAMDEGVLVVYRHA